MNGIFSYLKARNIPATPISSGRNNLGFFSVWSLVTSCFFGLNSGGCITLRMKICPDWFGYFGDFLSDLH